MQHVYVVIYDTVQLADPAQRIIVAAEISLILRDWDLQVLGLSVSL